MIRISQTELDDWLYTNGITPLLDSGELDEAASLAFDKLLSGLPSTGRSQNDPANLYEMIAHVVDIAGPLGFHYSSEIEQDWIRFTIVNENRTGRKITPIVVALLLGHIFEKLGQPKLCSAIVKRPQ